MRTKKLIYAGFALILVLALGYLAVQIFTKSAEQKAVKENREQIPAVILQDMTGKDFPTTNIPNKDFTLIIIFNPDCHFCQLEAEEMQEKVNDFIDFNVYFISTATPKEIQNFSEIYQINQISNIKFLHDDMDSFNAAVGANTVPFMMLYNNNHQLIKTYRGSVKLDLILQDAKEYRETSS